jgi:cellulose synthase/poly-beta-1,6-N-acetylglucosamine synthase-like glycosyltransferase
MGAAAIFHAVRWRQDRKRVIEISSWNGDVPALQETPLVSILLPAWNEEHNLDACIQSILDLRYPRKQLVVCAGGSDGTIMIARSYAGEHNIVLEQQPGEGKQGALGRAYRHSRGEIIFLTDADCALNDDCFERTVAPIIAGTADAATGSWRPLERQTSLSFVQYQWAHHVYREITSPDYISTVDGRNAAVRRGALNRVDAFEVEASIGTDYVLSKQLTAAGYRIRFVRESRVQTEYPEMVGDFWEQQSRWFRNRLLHGLRFSSWGDVFLVFRNGLAAIFLLALPPTWWLGTKTLRAGWITAVFHLCLGALRVTRILENREATRQIKPNYLHTLMYVPVGWLASFWGILDTLSPKSRLRW